MKTRKIYQWETKGRGQTDLTTKRNYRKVEYKIKVFNGEQKEVIEKKK